VKSDNNGVRNDAFWFGEAQSRVVVSVKQEMKADFENLIKASGIPMQELGTVTEAEVSINGQSWGDINYWKDLYNTAIEKHLSKELESEGALGMI
jgi:phosphoribosylformylglycinamidine synthase